MRTALGLLLSSVSVSWSASPCQQVKKEHGIVCMCNETYCDEIEPLGNVDDGETVVVYTSSLSGDRMTRSELSMSDKPNSGWQNITLLPSVLHQEIKGFGGAFTDSAALTFSRMQGAVQEKMLESYFGASGAEYTIGRVPIASCDFSTRVYSYDEVVDDMALDHFNVSMDDAYKIPLINRAVKKSTEPISFFASPWSSPPWMTKQNTTVHNPTLKDFDGPYAKSWALYFSKFFDEYAKRGIDFWAVTAQNEPAGNTGAWQDLKFSATDQATFIKTSLGPLLRANHPEVKIMMLDDQRIHLPKWTAAVLGDPEAAKYVDGIGLHWYASVEDKTPTGLYFGNMKKTHQAYPNVFMFATEACEGFLPWSQGPRLGDWGRAETYAHDILGDLDAFATGWTDWNLFLDRNGGPNWAKNVVDAPIILDIDFASSTEGSGDTFFKQPTYYAMAHFSKFIKPGSMRIDALSTSSHKILHSKPMESVAFLTPAGHIVVVVLNRDVAAHKFFIEVPSATAFASKSKTAAAAAAPQFVNVDNMPPHSMKTFVFKAPSQMEKSL